VSSALKPAAPKEIIMSRPRFFALALTALTLSTLVGACGGEPPVYEQPVSAAAGVAIGGYDTVAYHTEAAAIPGEGGFSSDYLGATWTFSSEENRALFAGDPARYAPAYGGHCSFAYSLGKVEDGNPELFDIVDGTLYLNSNPVAQMLWSAPE
jgi:YHS domain-containing protein